MTKANNKLRKTLIGNVTKISSKNTIKVEIEQKFRHKKYGKIMKSHKTYLVDYKEGTQEVAVGNVVSIGECKPVSKNKRWELIEIIK